MVKSHSIFSETMPVDKILDFIHENYSKPITNTYIGSEFGFHPNYVSSLIKLCTGMPLHKYILDIRLTRAINYLDSGTFSVGEIAEKCCFGDIYHFSKFFKSKIVISSTKYIRSEKMPTVKRVK